MCFKRKPKPPIPPILTLPYPEEPPDYTKNADNTDLVQALSKWMTDYRVPVEHHSYWYSIDSQLDMSLFVISNAGQIILIPAATSAENKTLRIRPEWCFAGIFSHEFAHISYSLLSEQQKLDFELIYNQLKLTDKWIQLVNKEHPYSLKNAVEGHADVYRFLGDTMPEGLKIFYPKLIGG